MLKKETLDKLTAALADAEFPLRTKIVQAFEVLNPLELAQTVSRLDLPDAVKGQILLLKVSSPPQLDAVDIDRLLEQHNTNSVSEKCREDFSDGRRTF